MEHQKDVSNDKEDVLLEWDHRVSFFQISVLKNVLMAFGIPMLVVGVILAILIGFVNGLVIMSIVSGIFLIGIFFATLVYRNGFDFTFRLTSNGIWSHMGKREENTADAAMVGGILTGSPGTLGAGLLAKAEQNVFIAWKDITKIKVVEKDCLIKIGASFGTKPIDLYCSPEHFKKALEILTVKSSPSCRT